MGRTADGPDDGWAFNAIPYVWMAGGTTNLRHAGFPIDVEADTSFRDILDNLDFGAMLAFPRRFCPGIATSRPATAAQTNSM